MMHDALREIIANTLGEYSSQNPYIFDCLNDLVYNEDKRSCIGGYPGVRRLAAALRDLACSHDEARQHLSRLLKNKI